MSARWGERWPSIASSTGRQAPGRVPAMSSQRPSASNISPIARRTAITCGSRIFATWSNWTAAGSTASVCIEGYSRKMLAGMASPHQDLTAVLQILFAALAEYGCPQALVSDNGSVFTARDYLAHPARLRDRAAPYREGQTLAEHD